MRRLILFILLFLATAALAQSPGAVRLSGFELQKPSNYPGPSQGAYGAEIEYFSSKNVSAVLAVSSEMTGVTRFVTLSGFGPAPSTSFDRIEPIDVLLRYHFANGSRLQPWLGAGPRLIRVAGNNNWRGVLDGGLTFALTRHFGIDVEAKRLYLQRATQEFTVAHDGDFGEGSSRRLSAGLSWTF